MKMNYLNLAIEYLNKSIEHIKSTDDSRLVYAALDMRLAIESVVFKKIDMLGEDKKHLPKSIWQPRRLIKYIEQIHPELNSEVTMKYAFSEDESAPPIYDESKWKIFTSTRSMNNKKLNKIYNELGSYVHLNTNKRSSEDIRKSLEKVYNTILPWIESSHIRMTNTLETHRQCQSCGKPLIYSKEWFSQQDNIILCMNDGCGAEYTAKPDSNCLNHIAAFSTKCAHCQEIIDVSKKQLIKYISDLNFSENRVLQLNCKCGKKTNAYPGLGTVSNRTSN